MTLNSGVLQHWPPPFDSVFWIPVLLVAAPVIGEAVFRILRWPRIIGYTFVGLFASYANLNAGGVDLSFEVRRVLEVALAVLLFEQGCRINLAWLRANPWLAVTSLAEAGVTLLMAFVFMRGLGLDVRASLAVGTICMVSSPAVIMRITAELNARGQVTERLLLLSALNTIYAVVVISLLLGVLQQTEAANPAAAILQPMWVFGGSIVIALFVAAAIALVQRELDLRDENSALLLIGILLLALSIVQVLEVSPLLVPLLAGMLLRKRDPRPRLWPRHFGTAGGVLVVLLFVVNGMTVDWKTVGVGGATGLLLVTLRASAKIACSVLSGRPAGLSLRQSASLGVALLPMSGVAFLLTASLHDTFPTFTAPVASALAGAIAVMEIVGPLATQWALKRCGEVRFDRGGNANVT